MLLLSPHTGCEDRVLDGPASEDEGPYALTLNTVELITILGALFP